MLVPILFVLALTAAGQPTHSFGKRSTYPNGIATFNNFAAQGNTVCGPKSGKKFSALRRTLLTLILKLLLGDYSDLCRSTWYIWRCRW